MQNQGLQIVPVQQQDYSQWEKYWLAYQNFLSSEFTPSCHKSNMGTFLR